MMRTIRSRRDDNDNVEEEEEEAEAEEEEEEETAVHPQEKQQLKFAHWRKMKVSNVPLCYPSS